jgi:hypothetical protein
MQFIEQKNRRNCGHIAVAVLTSTPLEKVTEIIGHKHGTKTKELVKALRALGFVCHDRVKPGWAASLHGFGIGQLHKPGRAGWHWIAIADGMVYDGNRSGPMTFEDYTRYQINVENARITSFLIVTRPGGR